MDLWEMNVCQKVCLRFIGASRIKGQQIEPHRATGCVLKTVCECVNIISVSLTGMEDILGYTRL